MRFAAICPPGLLKRYGSISNYHLLLPHVAKENPEYVKFYADEMDFDRDFVIVDNSAAEQMVPWDLGSIIDLAHQVNAHEVVIPDYLHQKDETLRGIEASESVLTERQWTGTVMAVPQGRNLDEWFQCLEAIVGGEIGTHVTTIGIPKLIEAFVSGGRNAILLQMEEGGFVDRDRFKYHLLGVGNNPVEAYRASRFNWIRGMDSALPIFMGLEGLTFHPTTGVLERPLISSAFFSAGLVDDKRPSAVLHNIACILNWCEGRPGHQT